MTVPNVANKCGLTRYPSVLNDVRGNVDDENGLYY